MTEVNADVLIGVIERNQQSLGHIGSRIEAVRNEIMSRIDVCHLEDRNFLDNMNGLFTQLSAVVDQNSLIIGSVKDLLIAHAAKSESTSPALLSKLDKLEKSDTFIQRFLVIFSTIIGIFYAVLIYYLQSGKK